MKVIVKGKYDITEAVLSYSLKESLDGISFKGKMVVSEEDPVQRINIQKGDKIQMLDYKYGTDNNKEETIFNGVVWGRTKDAKRDLLELDIYERTIYLEKSEDEYLFPKGTASDRLRQIANDWGIPLGYIADTQIVLDKTVQKGSLLSLIKRFLKETTQKSGKVYKIRMEDKLTLVEIGKNKPVFALESVITGLKDINTLDGAVTSVKVLGKSKDSKTKASVTGVFKKNDDKLGTLQKIKQDEKIKNKTDAEKVAKNLLNWGQVSISVQSAVDINTLRAGDKVRLYEIEYIVIDVTHNIKPYASMTIQADHADYIRSRYYD